MKSADDVFAHYGGEELAEDEVHDIKKSLERLLCARDVIAEELGLTTPPSVVVTAKEKDIDLTARHLGLDAKNSWVRFHLCVHTSLSSLHNVAIAVRASTTLCRAASKLGVRGVSPFLKVV